MKHLQRSFYFENLFYGLLFSKYRYSVLNWKTAWLELQEQTSWRLRISIVFLGAAIWRCPINIWEKTFRKASLREYLVYQSRCKSNKRVQCYSGCFPKILRASVPYNIYHQLRFAAFQQFIVNLNCECLTL